MTWARGSYFTFLCNNVGRWGSANGKIERDCILLALARGLKALPPALTPSGVIVGLPDDELTIATVCIRYSIFSFD